MSGLRWGGEDLQTWCEILELIPMAQNYGSESSLNRETCTGNYSTSSKTKTWEESATKNSYYTPPKKWKQDLNTSLYNHVHSGIAHSSRNVEATQVSAGGWMVNKMWYSHPTDIIQSKKEWNSDTYYNMNDSWGHYAIWTKPDTKDKYHMIPPVWNIRNSQIHTDGR